MSLSYDKGGEYYKIQKRQARQRYWNLTPAQRLERNKRTAQLNQLRRYGVWYKDSSRKYRREVYKLKKKPYYSEYFRCLAPGCEKRNLLEGRETAEKHLFYRHKDELNLKTWKEFKQEHGPYGNYDEYKAYKKGILSRYLRPSMIRRRNVDMRKVIAKAKDEFRKEVNKGIRKRLEELRSGAKGSSL